jgi:hypothetical protein
MLLFMLCVVSRLILATAPTVIGGKFHFDQYTMTHR